MSQAIVVTRNETNLTKRIQDIGGGVYGYTYEDAILRGYLPGFLADRVYKRISDVRFSRQPDNELVADLGIAKHLTRLSLAEATDETLNALAPLDSLQSLDISQTSVSDAAIPAIARQVNLELLDCNETAITDDGLKQLQQLRPLSFSIAAQRMLAALLGKNLVKLRFRNAQGDESESRLLPKQGEKIIGIEFVELPADEELEAVADIASLETLSITGQAPWDSTSFYSVLGSFHRIASLKNVTVQLSRTLGSEAKRFTWPTLLNRTEVKLKRCRPG